MSIGTQPKALLDMIVFVKESICKDQFLIPIIFLRIGGIRNLNQTMTIANRNLKNFLKLKFFLLAQYGVSRQI